MKHYSKYQRVIATKERSAGNERVGDMWNETKTFQPETPIRDIIEWAKDSGGKLVITIDETDADY